MVWKSKDREHLKWYGTLEADRFKGDGTSIVFPFTAGSIIFSDGTNLTQDNSNLFWDDIRKELQPNLIRIESDGSQASPALKFNDTNTGFFKSGDSIRLSINNSTKITVDTIGQVGIGTTSPDAKLHVVSASPLSCGYFTDGTLEVALASSDYDAAGYFTDGGSYECYIADPAQGAGAVTTGPSGNVYLSGAVEAIEAQGSVAILGNLAVDTNTLFVNAASNRVGMGTASPGRMLHVVSTGENPKVRIESTSTSGNYSAGVDLVTDQGETLFGQAGSAGRLISTSNAGDFILNNRAGDIVFSADTSFAERQFVIKENGWTGVGVANPTGNLQVQGFAGSNSEVAFFTGDGDGGDYNTLQIYGVGLPNSITNRERLTLQWNVANSQFWIHTDEGGTGTLRQLELHTKGNNPQLVLDIDGDVGIGTSSPGAKLHVSGTDGVIVPVGTTGQRVATQGIIRYNTTTSKFEGYTGAGWVDFH